MISKTNTNNTKITLSRLIQQNDQNITSNFLQRFKKLREKHQASIFTPLQSRNHNTKHQKTQKSTQQLSLTNISFYNPSSELSIAEAETKKKNVTFNFNNPVQHNPRSSLRSSILKKSAHSDRSSNSDRTSIKSLKKLKIPSSICSVGLGSRCSIASGSSMLSANNFGLRSRRMLPGEYEMKKYQQQKDSLRFNDEKFVDNVFPSKTSSVAYSSTSKKFQDVKWMRLSELFYDKNMLIYRRSMKQRSSVKVGAYQVRNMVDAFDCLKNLEGFLEEIFEESSVSMNGIYCLKVHLHGAIKVVTIDDFVPVIKQNGAFIPAFISTQSQESCTQIWPHLLQKAYAKIFTNYESLFQYQSINDWVATLLGNSLTCVFMNQPKIPKILRQLKETTGCMFVNREGMQRVGQVQKSSSKQPAFLINKNYYSFKQLSREYPKILLFNTPNTRISTIQSLKLTSKSHLDVVMYSFVISQTTSVSISIWQKDIKFFRSTGYKYSPIRMVLGMKQEVEEGHRWIGSSYGDTKVVSMENILYPGQYVLILMINWKTKPFQFNIKFSGEHEIEGLTRIEIKNHSKILSQMGCDAAQRFGVFRQVTNKICLYRYLNKQVGLYMQSIHNQQTKSLTTVKKTYKAVVNHPTRVFSLTQNIKQGILNQDIRPLCGIGTMIAVKHVDQYSLLAEK